MTSKFPTHAPARRIAILDDVPPKTAYDPDLELLKRLLAHAGITYDDCFHGWVTADTTQLAADLALYQPHFVLAVDRQQGKVGVLRALMGERMSIDDFRGSLYRAKLLVPGVKCMGTFHPSRVRIDYGLTGVVKFDLKRAREESMTDELVVPERRIRVCMPDGKEFD